MYLSEFFTFFVNHTKVRTILTENLLNEDSLYLSSGTTLGWGSGAPTLDIFANLLRPNSPGPLTDP